MQLWETIELTWWLAANRAQRHKAALMFYESLAHAWTSVSCIKKVGIWSLEFIVFFLSFKPLKLCHLCLIRRDCPRVVPLFPWCIWKKAGNWTAYSSCISVVEANLSNFVYKLCLGACTVKPKAVLKVFAAAGLNILMSLYRNSTLQTDWMWPIQ